MPYKTCAGTVLEVVPKIKQALINHQFIIDPEIVLSKNAPVVNHFSSDAVVLFFSKPDILPDLLEEAPAIAWEFPMRLLIMGQMVRLGSSGPK